MLLRGAELKSVGSRRRVGRADEPLTSSVVSTLQALFMQLPSSCQKGHSRNRSTCVQESSRVSAEVPRGNTSGAKGSEADEARRATGAAAGNEWERADLVVAEIGRCYKIMQRSIYVVVGLLHVRVVAAGILDLAAELWLKRAQLEKLRRVHKLKLSPCNTSDRLNCSPARPPGKPTAVCPAARGPKPR